MRNAILTAVIGAVGTIIASLISIYLLSPKMPLDNKPKVIAGMISEKGSNKPIGQAQITIVGRNEFDISQDNGNFRIEIHDEVRSVRLKILKEHYKPVDQSFDLPNENVPIQMTRKK